MYKVTRSALVSHSARNMFNLVNDVESYSDFLPWCGESVELERSDTEVIASVMISYGGIRKTFTTRNQLIGYEKTVLSLVDGPFSELSGTWDFTRLGDQACKIALDLEFDFSNKIVGKVVGPVFSGIANSMVDSFCKRADQIYGIKSYANN
jgi:ribosome-associated toxin RatA of RatAB toxin-antitoxin module